MIINESNVEKKPENICSIPLQEAPDNSKTTGLLTESASTGINLRKFPVYEDNVTNVLWQRWIACYLLYDWTPRHADHAFCNNKCMWVEQVYKKLEGKVIDAASLRAVMTDTYNQILHEDVEDFIQTHMRVWKSYNQILHEDVEDFIQTHMRVWKCDRSTVEFQVAKTIAEIFVEKE